MPKKLPKQVARDLARLGEEVVKETVRQPVELAKMAGEQIGVMPKDWGKEGAAPVTPKAVEKKEARRQKELAMARRRMRELTSLPRPIEPEVSEEERERQKELAREEEKPKPLEEPPTKRPRGTALISQKRRSEAAQPEKRVAKKIRG